MNTGYSFKPLTLFLVRYLTTSEEGKSKMAESLCLQHVITTLKALRSLTNFIAYGPGGSVPHSQGLSNNPYPDSNQPNSSY